MENTIENINHRLYQDSGNGGGGNAKIEIIQSEENNKEDSLWESSDIIKRHKIYTKEIQRSQTLLGQQRQEDHSSQGLHIKVQQQEKEKKRKKKRRKKHSRRYL